MSLRYTRLRKRHQKDVPEGKDFADVKNLMFLGFWKFSFTYFTTVTRDQKNNFLAVSGSLDKNRRSP